MSQENIHTAAGELAAMSDAELRTMIETLLVEGEELSEGDFARIVMYAKDKVAENPSLALADVLADATAARLNVSKLKGTSYAFDNSGVVVGMGGDDRKAIEDGVANSQGTNLH
jgi:hypothetical protein